MKSGPRVTPLVLMRDVRSSRVKLTDYLAQYMRQGTSLRQVTHVRSVYLDNSL